MRGTRRRHLLHKLVVSLHPSRGGRHLRTHLSHSPHRHHRREGVGRRRGSRGGLLRIVLPRGGRTHRRVLDLPRVGPLGPRRRRRRLREPSRGDGATRERGDRRRRRLLALVHAHPRLLCCGHRAVGSKAGGHGHRRGVESRKGGHTRGESHGETPGDSRGELRGNLGSLGGLGGSLGDDVEEAAPALALVEVVLANEVLLRVRGNLRRGARLHEVAGDASPVALRMDESNGRGRGSERRGSRVCKKSQANMRSDGCYAEPRRSIEGRVGCHLAPLRKRRDGSVRRGLPSARPAGRDASTRK
mmetsp:Transcript_2372/g.8943  ORF Transcript_2372/g.8943 Transcript_2372/m.8943 type:complete len:302 (-) Transcript_2372:543-1448(-)